MKTRLCALAILSAVAGSVQADTVTPMSAGELGDATEALRRAQANQVLVQTMESLESQSDAGWTPKHTDHSKETLWILGYVPLGFSPQGFYSFENATDDEL